MKEHPILFSTEMVRAILEGRKTQTRRVVKADRHMIEYATENHGGFTPSQYNQASGMAYSAVLNQIKLGADFVNPCPYGQPGDRLWVRETWAVSPFLNKVKPSELDKNPENTISKVVYRADIPKNDSRQSHYMWRPSIFMPRWASRITLEITNIRAERVQEISEDDTDAEIFGGHFPHYVMPEMFTHDDGGLSLIECFARYWDKLNAKRGFSWDVNPWVWVIEFKRIEPEMECV